MSWLVGAVLLLAIAIVLQMGLLAYAMYALIVVVLGSHCLARLWSASVAITREVNRLEAEIGDTVAVVLTIRNTSRWPVGWVLIEDLIPRHALLYRPPSLRLAGSRLLLTMLRPGQTRRLLYQLTGNRRGYYQLGPAVVETGDLFGLQRHFRTQAPPEFLTVMPKVYPLEGYDVASRRPIGEIRMTYRLFEDPTRNSGVRKYEAGDPLNRVHWRATARTGVLQSKTYEPSTIAGATLLLDLHATSYPARHEPVRSDLAVTAAASIANALYEMNQQVGLVTNGRDAADRIRQEGWSQPAHSRADVRDAAGMLAENQRLDPVMVPTARGAATLLQLFRALARLERTDGLDLAALVFETSARLPNDATVMAILPCVTHATAIALGSLRKRGLAVVAIINTFETTDFADFSAPLLAEGIATTHLRDEPSIPTICQRFASAEAFRWFGS